MRVLVVAPFIADRLGGVPAQAKGLANGLARNGARVTVIATGEPGDQVGLDEAIDSILHHARAPRRWLYCPELVPVIDEQVRATDVVEVHDVWPHPILAAVKACRRHAKPFVVRPSGSLTEWDYSRGLLHKALYRRTIGRPVFSSDTVWAVASPMEERELKKLGLGSRVRVVPIGFDDELFGPLPLPSRQEERSRWFGLRNTDARRVALFFSRLEPQKGLDILLEAWSSLAAKFPDWVLVVAGSDNKGHLKSFRAQVQASGIGQSVIFRPPVSGGGRAKMLATADLFVLPSRMENFGIVIPEAMASGLPVITTDATPWGEFAGDYLCGLSEPTVAGIQEVLSTALRKSPEALGLLGSRGRDWVTREFSWAAAGKRSLDLYSELLRPRPEVGTNVANR